MNNETFPRKEKSMNNEEMQEVIKKTQKLLQERGRNKKLSAEQVNALMSALSSQQKEETIVFKANDKVINAGEVRVECNMLDEQSICVILTQEGIIIDCIEKDEVIATSSMTYCEKFDQMRGL